MNVMKTWMRRPALLLLSAFLAVTLVAGGFTFAKSGISRAYAATATPTITVSDHTVHPHQKITVTGQGFAPSDTVYVYLDYLDYSFGMLTCDANGNCSGTVTIPQTGPQGQHMLLAEGSQVGEAVANTPIIINPTVFFDTTQYIPNHGGPGTETALTGYAFQLNETVSIYWGGVTGTLLGTAKSDNNLGFFYFRFAVPTHIAPGKYPVTVVRASGQKPATLSATFTIVPPKVSSAAGIRSGQVLKLHLSGFQANESVDINWNANGGQQIRVVHTNDLGAFNSPDSAQVFIPSAPPGSYTITFMGESSGLQVSAPLNIGPGIVADGPTNPGGTISVKGGGFSSDEALTIFIEGQKQATSVSATTADDGSFQVNLTAPLSLTLGTTYHVVATNSDGTERATGFFFVLTPSINWANSDIYHQGNTATYGSTGTISGQNFPANERVALYWNYQQAGQTEVGTVQAAADGSFSFDLTTPSSPFTGNATIEAIAATSTYMASYQVQPQPAVSFNQTSVMVGQTATISGGSFDSNATVTIGIEDSTVLSTATVASDGTITTSFALPTNLTGGPDTISVSDGTVSATTTLVVDVSLTITPTSGSAGTTINVQSPNFTNSGNDFLCFADQPYIAWYDPTTGTSQDLDSACLMPRTVTAPANLVSGQTYEVQLIVGGYMIGQATFTAQ